MRIKVSAVRDLPPGERRIVPVGETSVGVFNLDGSYYAIENSCPHQGGPVCMGKVNPLNYAEVLDDGTVVERLTPEAYVIACPWHGWEYDVRTGECLANARKSLKAYPVTVDGDELYIEVEHETAT